MSTTKEINRLNDLLRQELGSNPFGEGLYKWQFSENLLHPMWQEDKMDYKADEKSGLVLAIKVPVFRVGKLCPTLSRQWVMTRWLNPGSPESWQAKYGGRLSYPERGDWMPVSVPSGYLTAGPTNVSPTNDVTWAFIDQMKIELRKRLVEHQAEIERGMEQREKDTDRVIEDRINDAVGPFNSVPGKRGYHVSFPDPKVAAQ